ncbi:bifunctional serine/threonine-protein kinase/formylglycine-generating enzyme family protein [Novipirellula caenicola]|uniref:Serine/threonine-protein kinase PknD n=1 Tax=Novipirellula caenicola TaxID=1536901 RepID=A0ABP9VP66_9BACT
MDPKKTKNSDSLTFEFLGTESGAPIVDVPERIEEFVIREVLGRGGFGTVFLAYDTTLQRDVALKIPHQSLISKPTTVNLYLREARAIASLDHPNIIPVYRAASAANVSCYIVTKRIRGSDLSQWVTSQRPCYEAIADLLAQVTDAIAFAHQHGVVHRDIKPSNILIDEHGRPYVADFGLALRDVDPRGGPAYVGTPAYMSPEQARGEGHRVDGRSDLYSIGVVMYELLTGQRPFQSTVEDGLYDEIRYNQPIHPRKIAPHVPSELARICLKSLSKSINERYATGEALANDLRQWLAQQGNMGNARLETRNFTPAHDAPTIDGGLVSPQTPPLPRVVPKGLRPFDTRDADFFLQLLPGPRDHEGVPEIIRFWLSKLDTNTDAHPVPVGVIYGPSGCGKTSLVRAGIIPRLADDVISIYVQATADDTERTLHDQIVSRLSLIRNPENAAQQDIVESFAMIRRLQRRRVVIFIDQFEQWLFANPDGTREALVQALRQCDGEYLQCVLMVRDDFWMGVTRLMQALDYTIAENVNATAVDLFDESHARNVLALFGAAYDRLPEQVEQRSASQNQFLDQAVRSLASGGRVICVQLALLTEMLKNRPWDDAEALFADGGAGLGMRFLDETFDSELARRRTRIHAEGAHRVLRALLPEASSRIKGSVRTKEELAQAASYREKSSFRELLSILDREMHLITPTDRDAADTLDSDQQTVTDSTRTNDSDDSSESVNRGNQSGGYQLTHDFLIAPIRQWIEYRNRSTKHGKARLRLEEFSDLYRVRPLPQSLPTLSEYLTIRRYTDLRSCSVPQQKMMQAAQKRHLTNVTLWSLAMLLVLGGAVSGYRLVQNHNQTNASRMAMERLLDAKMNDAVLLATELHDSDFATAEATRVIHDESATMSDRVRAALVLADDNPKAADLIADYVLEAPVDEVVTIARKFVHATSIGGSSFSELWSAQLASRDKLIRAACMLANDPLRRDRLRTQVNLTRLMKLLLNENPLWIQRWGDAFNPIGRDLVPLLDEHLKDPNRKHESVNAANLMVAFAANDLSRLITHLPHAFPSELVAYTDAISRYGAVGRHAVEAQWRSEIAESSPLIDVSRPWGSPWWCVGTREPVAAIATPPLPPSLNERLRWCEAAIGSHAILLHKVAEADVPLILEELADAGYRIAELAPFHIGTNRFWAMLLLRDGAVARYCIDVNADELRQQNQAHRSDKFFPDTLHVYRQADSEQYCCVWIRVPDNSALLDADLYVDVHHELHHENGWGPLVDRGIKVPRTNLTFQKSDGEEYFSSIRWKLDTSIDFHEAWHQSHQMCNDLNHFGRANTLVSQQFDNRLFGDSGRDETAVWWSELPVEVHKIDPQPRREHLRQTRAAMSKGYYPVSLAIAETADDSTPQFGSLWWRPQTSIAEHIEKCNRLRNLLAAMFKLGDRQQMAAAMQADFSEATRGAMIESFAAFELSPDWLIEHLENIDQDIRVRRSCAMALAIYPTDAISESHRDHVISQLSHWYTESSDPGLRSAIQSIATAWDVTLDPLPMLEFAGEFRTSAGDRMVVIQPDDLLWAGSPATEPGRDGSQEPQSPFRLGHAYAIATHEVTTAQFRQFRQEHQFAPRYTPSEDCPVIGVNWFDAAKYCRWLSEQEGIPESQMCYPPIDEIEPGMQLPNNHCERIGYRLPSELEWEFACRGGSSRGRWFGFDPGRLRWHAWTAENSNFEMHPVARLLPNDYGLFDMLGNAMEWCHTAYATYPSFPHGPASDPATALTSIDKETRMASRGGAILYQPLDARAAQRNWHSAFLSRVYLSFRIARTMPSENR